MLERRNHHGADSGQFTRSVVDPGIKERVVGAEDPALAYAQAGQACVALHPCPEQPAGNAAGSAVDHFVAFRVLHDGALGVGHGGDSFHHRIDDTGKVEAVFGDLRLQTDDLHQDVRIGADTALHVGHGPSALGMVAFRRLTPANRRFDV